jgi:hypothetical protein
MPIASPLLIKYPSVLGRDLKLDPVLLGLEEMWEFPAKFGFENPFCWF